MAISAEILRRFVHLVTDSAIQGTPVRIVRVSAQGKPIRPNQALCATGQNFVTSVATQALFRLYFVFLYR